MWTVAAATVWGAVAGWLIRLAAYRMAVPTGTGWHRHCPDGHPLPGGARGWLTAPPCRPHTHTPLSRTVLPAATALICGLLAAATQPHPELLAWLLLAPIAVLLAVVDARVHRLPDVLTLPLAGAALALLGAVSLLPGEGGLWTGSLVGGLVLAAVFFLMFLASPKSMGFGDVKLALTVGAVLGWYGWRALVLGVFAGYLIAAVHGITLLARRKATGTTRLPFGPPLLIGTLLGLTLGAGFA
ncbi:prepilin peptidase [Streptomyces sp. NPDC050400]|uniref:prepilin peptidase n=1 Tax=Streptomyces sp. NPDC050400 TaxID=3365610 RepID=UPI0037AFE1D4